MRDALDMPEFADHHRQWDQWVDLFRRLHAWLKWAGAAFESDGLRHGG